LKENISMRNKLRAIVATVVALIASALAVGPAYGQAYTTKFVTSITYQNVGNGPAAIRLQFYNQNSASPVTINLANLAQNAGAAIFVGSINDPNLTSGFRGAAVMSSDQPIVATMVQVPQNSATVRNRPLSNGFSPDAGASSVLIASVLKQHVDYNTQFSVQNVDTAAVDVTVRFISAATANLGAVVHTASVANLPAGSVTYFDAGTINELPADFNGSAQVTAVRSGTTTAGKVVATAIELGINNPGAGSFEGLSGGATTVYAPSALCNAFGLYTTAYAVQNTNAAGGEALTVRVRYRARPTSNPSAPVETFETTAVIPAGAKQSFLGCGAANGPSGIPSGYTGSAVISVTQGTGNIVAIGKVFGGGVSSSAPAPASGASKLAVPYVRYSVSQFDSGARQRTFISVQNVGDTDLPAGAVTVRYLNREGQTVGTHTLPAIPTTEKASTNPLFINNASGTPGGAGDEFGFYADGNNGGSAIIEGPAGSRLVAIVRVQSVGVGEDYTGIPIAP
jgi:hypothetical protein